MMSFEWSGTGPAPFTARVMYSAVEARREERGWMRNGYRAATHERVIQAAGARIPVWVVLVWEDEG